MADMLVNLYEIEDNSGLINKLRENGILIKRALAPDMMRILEFIKENFNDGWVNECRVSLSSVPSTCYIAVENSNVVGFACFDATAKAFFGPTGVKETMRGKGVGKALMYSCLNSMKEFGYAYAVIGWPADTAVEFYRKNFNAIMIGENSDGVYSNLIKK